MKPRVYQRSVTVMAVLAVLAAAVPVSAQTSTRQPLGGSKVDPGRLPRPVGIGLTLYDQSQDYDVTALSFNVPGISIDPGSDLEIDNKLQEVNLKIDYWLLPYLNVFGLIGNLDGKTKVDLSRADLPIPLSRLTIDYDGEVYGGGVTLSAGSDHFFGSLTGIYTETDLSGEFDSSVEALVITPKVGLYGRRGAFWIGAMYQDASESHAGTVGVPFIGAVDFAVELEEQDAWNFLVGMSGALSEHWFLELEGGVAGRLTSSISITYRF